MKRPRIWMATAKIRGRSEQLLCLGESIVQIKKLYEDAYAEMIPFDLRHQIQNISVYRWNGADFRGRWNYFNELPIPKIWIS